MAENITVLILEDDASKLQRLAAFLRDNDLVATETIFTAPDAATARRVLADQLIDVLVLDLSVPRALGDMPEPEVGFELLEDLIDARDLLMPAQIIGLTGFAEVADKFIAQFGQHGVALVRYDPTDDGWQSALELSIRRTVARRRAEETVPREYGSDVGVVCARPNELDALLRHLGPKWAEAPIAGDPTIYYRAEPFVEFNDTSVVAASCPRMGMSAAAVTATKLIQHFAPRFLVMTGITAGIRGQVSIGDVVVADQSWDWGVGKWERQDGQLRFKPSPHSLALDSALRAPLERLGRDVGLLARIRDAWPSTRPQTPLALVLGPVASGAAVIAAQSMTEQIAAQHRKLIGIDMEIYAVFAAADESMLPRPVALAIKGVSDFADEEKSDDWQPYAAYAGVSVLRALIANGLTSGASRT